MTGLIDGLRYLDDEAEEESPLDLPRIETQQRVEDRSDVPDAHVLRTTTVSSEVVDEDENPLGHVLLLDYDDVDPAVPIGDARDMTGTAIVLRSSPGSYHIWDLSVRGIEEQLSRRQLLRGSEQYVDCMRDRGEFCLRVGPKETSDGEVYRAAPVPVLVSYGVDRPLSEPHISWISNYLSENTPRGVEERLAEARDDRTTGSLLARERREVLSDEAREVLHG